MARRGVRSRRAFTSDRWRTAVPYYGYLDAVDWTDPGQVARAVRVFEMTAKHAEHTNKQTA